MNQGEYVLIGGTSGTGKSTRTQALFEFLESRETPEPVLTGNGIHFGYRFQSCRTTFMCHFSMSSGDRRFIGADAFASRFSSVAAFHEFVVDYIKATGHRLILEGSSVLHTSRWFPAGVFGAGISRGMWIVFTYDNFADYENRIEQRTGTPPLQDGAGWLHNKAYHRHIETINQQIRDSSTDVVGSCITFPFDAPLDVVGLALGFGDVFAEWCLHNDLVGRRRLKKRSAGLLED